MICDEADQFFRFVTQPGSPEGRQFGGHLRSCVRCRSRLAAWESVESRLGMTNYRDSDDHPSAEVLLRLYKEGSSATDPSSDAGRHVATCESCRAEIRLLRQFNFTEAARVAAEAAGEFEGTARANSGELHPSRIPDQSSDSYGAWTIGSVLDSLRTLFDRLARPVLVVVLLALVLWFALPALRGEQPLDPDSIVYQDGRSIEPRTLPPQSDPGDVAPGGTVAAQAVPRPDGGAPSDSKGDGVEPLVASNARERSTTGSAADGVGKTPSPEVAPPPSTLVVTTTDSPRDPVELRREEPGAAEEPASNASEQWLLAALDSLPPPAYSAPSDMMAFDWQPIIVRSGGVNPALTEVRILAPGHVAETIRPSPTLFWQVDEEIGVPLEVTLVRAHDGIVLLEYRDDGPIATGLHELDLAAHGVLIEEGPEYRLFLSAVTDPARRSRDRRTASGLRRVAPRSELPSTSEQAARMGTSLGHVYASSGLWIDSLEFFIRSARGQPPTSRAAEMRDALLQSADLPPIDR